MNQRQARDWSKELWIKQHVREPLDELLWPLMQRAVREYLRKRAEADGTLIVDRDDPIDALVRALGAHEPEAALARQAVAELLREGVLESDGRSISMPERPASQARMPVLFDEQSAVSGAQPTPKQTSTSRVREHRERKRNERNAQASVSPSVSTVPEAVSVPVSLGVPPSVSASRGHRNQHPPDSQKDQKDQIDAHHHPAEEARAGGRGSPPVSSSVSGETDDDEDDEETLHGAGDGNGSRRSREEGGEPAVRSPASLEQALRLEITTRAALVMDRTELAEALRPDQWPEVRAVAAAFATARGCPSQPLGRYAQDNAVEHAVALYAAGYSQADLVHVVRAVAKQDWAKGKGLGSLLTFKVVDANRPKPLAKTEANLSPRAASVLARVREGRPIREAG